MQELFKTSGTAECLEAVSARELYNFLEVKGDFTTWCKRMFSYGFKPDVDFTPVLGKTSKIVGRPSKDYALTINCAKSIAMIQKTAKGKQVRQYYIDSEKRLNNLRLSSSSAYSAALVALADQVLEAEQRQSPFN